MAHEHDADSEAIERSAALALAYFQILFMYSGDWHELVKQTIPESYLPRFTEEEILDLKVIQFRRLPDSSFEYIFCEGSADFFCHRRIYLRVHRRTAERYCCLRGKYKRPQLARMQRSLRVRLQFRLACGKCGRSRFELASGDAAYVTLCIETNSTKWPTKKIVRMLYWLWCRLGSLIRFRMKYISEYGFTEPFEGQRY